MKILKIIAVILIILSFTLMLICVHNFSFYIVNLNFDWFFWLLLILQNIVTVLIGVNILNGK